MSEYRRSKSHKITTGIIGIMMLFVVLFSVFFMAHEADHDCAGEDCPVCACIAQCESSLTQLGAGLAALSAVVLPAFLLLLTILLSVSFFTQKTPVTRKVRLNH